MTIIVEDGSVIPGANSYVTTLDVRSYATERAIPLPADDVELEPKIHLAMDWFEGHTFIAQRSFPETQELSFPVVGLVLNGSLISADTIPSLVKKIIAQATCDAVTIELEPSYAGNSLGHLKKKKLDVLEKEYFPGGWATEQPRLVKLVRMLEPLINGGLSSGRLKVNRV